MMVWSLDARIPLILLADRAALAAALADGGPAAVLAKGAAPVLPEGAVAVIGFDPAAHPVRCDCGTCGGRNAAALALDLLFQARARGSVPWFARVVALLQSDSARTTVREALEADTVTRARYRLAMG